MRTPETTGAERELNRRDLMKIAAGAGATLPMLAMLGAASPAGAAPKGQTAIQRALLADNGSTLIIEIAGGINDLDPHSTYATMGSTLCLGLYEMLVQYKDDSATEIAPMLAQSFEANEDNSVYTFTLPEGALFSDGSPCDAEAVKASFVRFRRMERGPYLVISRFCDDPETMIEVVDPVTVRFNLGSPQPLFLAAMASSYGPFIVNPVAVEENATDDDPFAHEFLSFDAAGGGPYILTEADQTARYVMERNENYWRGWDGEHFEKVIFRVVPENATRRQLLESGDADAATYNLTPEDVATLKENADLQTLIYPTTRVNWATFNAAKLNLKARQGLSYAFPYDEVVNGAYKDLIVRSGPIPSTVTGADPEVFLYSTDLEKAKALLLEAGFAEGDSFDYQLPSEDEVEKTVAQLFQANLQSIGFDLELVLVDYATHYDIMFGDAPAEDRPMMFGANSWWPDYNDPWNQLAPNFLASAAGNGGANFGFWVNDRFEAIMEEAKNFTDQDQLVTLMKEAQNILTEQDPPVVYYGESLYYTILGGSISGFVPNPLYLESYRLWEMSRG